jgi:hypothetical protein
MSFAPLESEKLGLSGNIFSKINGQQLWSAEMA